MKAVSGLGEGYREIYAVDLQKDKKTAVLVNAAALLVAVVMALPMAFVVPLSTMFDTEQGLEQGLIALLFRLVASMVLMIVCLVLHELTHGVAMKLCGTKKVRYGFTGLYEVVRSDDYYDKTAYIFIALAPVVLWGIVIALVNGVVNEQWFWVVYLLQIINVSGAVGNLFVTIKFAAMPKDILVKDDGVSMTVYSRE